MFYIPAISSPNNCSKSAAQLPALQFSNGKPCSNIDMNLTLMVREKTCILSLNSPLCSINPYADWNTSSTTACFCRQPSIPLKQKSNQEALHFLSTALARWIRLSLSSSEHLLVDLNTIAGGSLNCDQHSIVVLKPVTAWQSCFSILN